MDWDDMDPVEQPASQNAAPNWDDLEPHDAQQASAPNWDDLQPHTVEPDSAFTTGLKSFARSAVPSVVGAGAGLLAAGAAAPVSGPIGAAAAGVAAGAGAGIVAQRAQDAITDALGITDPAQESADLEAHPTAAAAGSLATAAITFGTSLESQLARRALSGGIVGGVNVGEQYAEKGEVDPTEAALATGVGAALPNTRAWAQGFETAGSRLAAGFKGGRGTQVNPNAAQSAPDEQAVTTNTPSATSPGPGAALPHDMTPGTVSDQASENPAAGMEATPGQFHSGSGDISRDQGKLSVPAAEGVPGADSTPVDTITPGLGGQDTQAALKADQTEPNVGSPAQVPTSATPAGVEPMANAPPEGQNGPPSTPPPDTTGLQAPNQPTGAPQPVGNEPVSTPAPENAPPGGKDLSIPADNSIPDFLKRQKPEAPPEIQAMARQNMPKNLTDATKALLKKLGASGPDMPDAAQKAAEAADTRLGRVPLKARQAFDQWFKGTAFNKIFNPGGIDESGARAEDIMRGELGQIARRKDQVDTDLSPEIRNFVDNLDPEHQRELQIAMQEKNPMERLKGFPEAEPFVRSMRKIMADDWDFKMKKGVMDPNQFEEDHFPQLWKNTDQAAQFLDDWRTRQGSTAGFKAKQIPDIPTGLAAGLELRYDNPIDALHARLNGDYKYQMLNGVLDRGIREGVVRGIPQNGDIRLNAKAVGDRTLYAPEGFATVFNNHYSAGIRSSPAGKQIMDVAQPVTNWGTGMLLSVSAFHPFTIMNEAFINQIKKGLLQMNDNPVAGLKTLGKVPMAPYSLYKAGQPMKNEWTQRGTMGPELTKVVDLAERANARMMGHSDPTMKFVPDAWKGFANEWATTGKNIAANFGEAKTPLQTAGAAAKAPLMLSKATLNSVGAVMQKLSDPLFKHVIPTMKAGAFRENIGEWLRQNPNATDAQQAKAARKEWDDIENRFGLMTHDNLFWNNAMKEGLQMGLTSATWTTGAIRNIAGGTLAAVKNPKAFSMKNPNYDPRISSVLALGLTVSAMSAAYQFLKTGEPPKSMYDLMAGRTGGQTLGKQPERALLPGFQKDVYGWLHDPVQEAENKIGVVPKTIGELLTNKGWNQTSKGARFGPIANPNAPFMTRMKQYGAHVLQNFQPISAQQVTKPKSPATKISLPERLTAIREAPAYLNPQGSAATLKFQQREWQQAHPK
jgi:hypothetical protein